MDCPSLAIDYEALGAYMTAVAASTTRPSFCGRHQAHAICASDLILSLHNIDSTENEESIEMEYMIALISLLIIGFQPPLELCSAIRRTLYARDDFLDCILDHDELGAVFLTRLQQLQDLCIGGTEED